MRRFVGLASAAAAVAALFVPLSLGGASASAWETLPQDRRCAAYPTSATFYIVIDSSVAERFRTGLTRAAQAWSAWSNATGVTIQTVTSQQQVPAGGLPVSVTVGAYTASDPGAYASAAVTCGSNGMPNGGRIGISVLNLGTKTSFFTQYVLTHEIGHIMGLGHYHGLGSCSTVMHAETSEGEFCMTQDGPYMDDVAGAVGLWRPNFSRGFPANSRIANPRTPSYALASSYSGALGSWNPISFATPTTDGYSDWTFVRDKGNDRWGWLVNAATGLCATYDPRNLGFGYSGIIYMGRCNTDAGRWYPRVINGRTQLVNKSQLGLCLGARSGLDYATVLSCADIGADLKVERVTSTRTKRSLPDAETVGQPIRGSQSGRCVTVTGGSRAVGAGLSLRSCDGTAEQKWGFRPTAGGYALQVYRQAEQPEDDIQTPELCASASGGSVSVQSCQAVAGQTWTFEANGNIRNQGTGTCLNVSGGATGDGAALIVYGCADSANMVWAAPETLTTGAVSLAPVSSSSGGVLATAPAPAGDADRRPRTVLAKTSAADASRWGFAEVPGTSGGGLIRNLDSGLCLRWRGFGAQAGVDAACDGTDSSYRWARTAVNADGSVRLQNQYTAECLDVWGGADTEGTVIGTYACNGGTGQSWRPFQNAPAEPAPQNAPTVGGNLALFGTASQSSTYGEASARKAIDGTADGDFTHNSVTHTLSEKFAWWQVDLGGSSSIDTITLFNRTDCCTARSSNVWILASDTPFPAGGDPAALASSAGVASIHLTGNTAATAEWKPGGGSYRYIRVQLGGTDFLSLAELSILPPE